MGAEYCCFECFGGLAWDCFGVSCLWICAGYGFVVAFGVSGGFTGFGEFGVGVGII